MSVEHTSASTRGAAVLSEENQGVYAALFSKINLSPISELGGLEAYQNTEALSEASADERVTAAVSVFLDLLKKSSQKVERLDKTLLDEHIASLDAQISRQLDAVMHHPDFQRVESTWRGVKSLIDQTDFRQNVRIELLDISKEHLVQDFEDVPEIAQSGLYVHTYTQEYDTPGGEPIAAAISNYEFDRSPQDIALLRNISKVAAAAHMPFIGSVGPAFFGKESMEEVAAIKDIGNYFDRAEYIKWKSFRDSDDPLQLDPLQSEYLLRPMRLQDGHTEIYSVDRVTASRNAEREDYVPFTSFRHKGGMLRDEAPERYFHTRLRRAANGLHDTWLILGGEGFDADRLRLDESLSLRLTGTNGQLPRKALQSTLLDTLVQSTQAGLRVRNLCAPTLPCYPPNRDRFHWRVLSHLGSNFLPMLDNADVLRGTLALYDWTGSELNRRRLEGIVEVRHHLIQRFEKGFLLRGVDIEVTLDANGFSGEGDISLFGEMLSRFFALYADIHLFNRLTLILQPTGKCLRWNENHSQRIPG
ncbi:type VI secretion system baseplate subunit TssF [Pseudomonas nitroreducens]|uniref:type VI secretion system contractile sheath domain-containing protein n=1 Tax=Pseudomonas nitroreducens TaxID=46680 RepID=UPI002F35B75F